MAVTLKGQTAVYEGTSTDTKPTDADNNAIFKELDTGIRYYYDGTDWNEIPSSGGGGGGGTGTDNYNDLNNKPSINGTILSGNKSLDNLGIQAKLTFDSAPTEGSENPVESGGVYSALAGKQDAISDLSTIRSGAAAGATAVQPATLDTALAGKQDALSSEQLAAVNSGIDSTKVAQIETNKSNISYNTNNGVKNIWNVTIPSNLPSGFTITRDSDGGFIFNGNTGNSAVSCTTQVWFGTETYVLSGCPSGGSDDSYRFDILRGENSVKCYGDPVEASGFVQTTSYACRIRIAANYTCNNLKFYPMICLKSLYDADPSYQPYAMSNAELTAAIQALQAQLAQ